MVAQEMADRTPSRRVAGGVAIVAAGALLAAASAWALFGQSETPSTESGGLLDDTELVRVGSPAPDFELPLTDGSGTLRLSEFRGKVVVLNWFASWCEPCRREFPLLEDAHRALADEVVVLGVDYGEGRETAAGFVAEMGVTFPTAVDATGEVGRAYGLFGLPTTFVIGRDGEVLARHAGELDVEKLQGLLDAAGITWSAQ